MLKLESVNFIGEKYALISLKKEWKCEWRAGQYFILRYGENFKGQVVFPIRIKDRLYFGVCKDWELFSYLEKNGFIEGIEGPCGKPLDISSYKRPVGVSVGEGIFPLLSLYSERKYTLYHKGEEIKTDTFEIKTLYDLGHLKDIIDNERANVILTAGSNELSEEIVNMNLNIDHMACVDTPILDGTGLCLICRVYVGGEMKLNCVDGMWFSAKEVDWESLKQREVSLKDA